MKHEARGSRPSSSLALACLFAALLCAGSYLSFPLAISPVPLALGNFFAVLGGLLLGPLWGAAACGLYVVIGALGFPVFSGGRGGFAHLLGPTGGYLAGYIAGAAVSGLFARRRKAFPIALGACLGFMAILACGAAGLRFLAGADLSRAWAVGILPFLPGDGVKAVLATLVAWKLGPFADSLRSGSIGA